MANVGKLKLILRVGIFAFTGIVTLQLVSLLLNWTGYLVQAAMAVFASAAVANALTLRIYERASLNDIGLGWRPSSPRHLLIGFAGGLGSALLVTGGPVLLGLASIERDPARAFSLPSLLFVSVVLLFGAVGEEMLFRGYACQLLMKHNGMFSTLMPVSALFALAHSNNLSSDYLGLFNTFLWGLLLGLSFLRSGDLWLPIGIHFGWNWGLPLLGSNVSGFTMGTTGLILKWNVGKLWSGGDYGPEGGLLSTLVLPILGYWLWKAPVETQVPYLLQEDDGQ
jgi:uncharacterized protein